MGYSHDREHLTKLCVVQDESSIFLIHACLMSYIYVKWFISMNIQIDFKKKITKHLTKVKRA